jgi:hypothetical protein
MHIGRQRHSKAFLPVSWTTSFELLLLSTLQENHEPTNVLCFTIRGLLLGQKMTGSVSNALKFTMIQSN